MNSRERILTAIDNKEPDRVPIDIGSTTITGISAIAYYNLKRYLDVKEGNVRVIDIMQQLARVENWFIEKFDIDAIDVGRVFWTNEDDWYDIEVNGIKAQFPRVFQPKFRADGAIEIVHSDGTVLGRMSNAALVLDQTYYPFGEDYPEDINFSTLSGGVEKNVWSKSYTPPMSNMGEKRFWRNLKEKAIELKVNSHKALCLNLNISIFQGTHSFRGMDKILVDLIRKPKKVQELAELLAQFYLGLLRPICSHLGEVIDVITIGDDLAENNGPMLSPKLYRKYFKPYHMEICQYIKKKSSMKVFFHTCGSVSELIPDLIECGVDILNPIQINARDMDPKMLKSEFGDDIAFWGGGVDTRNVLPSKSPEEVKKHVTELLEIFAPGGGFIWNTVHNILPDVPPENIVAMLDAVMEYNERNY
ncbi:MAG: methyltransferase [Candidatus Lokiarchaeota archaeon]|nr:methyltransferase [Candidatus Lokiarchaeota archaeon]MBD3199866.1 methyltransferase [Candidatus Lokiarchaeota archaeon]